MVMIGLGGAVVCAVAVHLGLIQGLLQGLLDLVGLPGQESAEGLSEAARSQIMELRLGRVATAAIVGAALALAGVVLQSLLRNPLASPDILGPSTGASLAVMLTVYVSAVVATGAGSGGVGGEGGGGGGFAGFQWTAGPALIGALATLALVYALSQRRGVVDPTGLIIIGVIVNIMCGSGIMLVQYLMWGVGMTFGEVGLLVGSIPDGTPWERLALVGGVVLLAGGGVWWTGRAMDAAVMGDDEARSVGVRLGWLRAWLFLAAGVLTTSAVVLAGPIGFVGLICPHAVRLLMGIGRGGHAEGGVHRALLAGSAMCGAALMIGADALVRSVNLGSGRLPVGIVTALVGGTAFIVLLRGERRGVNT